MSDAETRTTGKRKAPVGIIGGKHPIRCRLNRADRWGQIIDMTQRRQDGRPVPRDCTGRGDWPALDANPGAPSTIYAEQPLRVGWGERCTLAHQGYANLAINHIRKHNCEMRSLRGEDENCLRRTPLTMAAIDQDARVEKHAARRTHS